MIKKAVGFLYVMDLQLPLEDSGSASVKILAWKKVGF